MNTTDHDATATTESVTMINREPRRCDRQKEVAGT
jgi:hypothetical protein